MAITIKHKKVSTILDTDDTSLVRPSDWNDTHDLTGTISVSNGGTGADNATDATNNLLPTQTGQSGKYLSTDGTNTQWLTVPSSGGGSSVSYYLNGGVSQGTFGGNTYYQMNKTPVTATPANFTIATNGYIAQFITDVNDPSLLNIPAGNWNFEMYFSASSGGGSPSFYVELYKYNGTTFTLISSGSTSPESITGGTVKDVYISALAVPATTLALTDRLAVRVYVNNSGRTITLYTQDNNLCQVITTFSTGITALNGLTAQVQTFATGTTGTDFNISSATSTHTFNLPTASASNRGALSSSDWSTFNDKANAFTYTTNYIPYGQGTTTPLQSANLQFNGTTLTANDITDSSLTAGRVTYAGTGGNLRDASNFTYDGTNLVAGAIQNTPIGSTTANTGKFSTLETTGTSTLGTGSSQYIQVEGGATAVLLSAQGAGSNIPLALQPKGTGAIQAQATTSTSAGGNARGTNAVDWQTSRGNAVNVASATGSVLTGGLSNTCSGAAAFVGSGQSNQATGLYSFVGSGIANVASGQSSALCGGASNTASGYYGFVGSGQSNSTTSNSAVTTQTGTMNGTTAVTLSGSNANIKVGQLITGTSITGFPSTYVAAISGTSLTLSQAASGSSTSTLSFFTPHGVVVGGGNNQATGAYSFIGGGGDAGTAANRNVASGDWSAVVGGRANQATGNSAFVGAGGWDGTFLGGNTASGSYSSVVGGFSNTASANGGFIGGGQNNTANGIHSFMGAGAYGTARSIVGNHVFSACNQPLGASPGISQSALLVLAVQTTDATATALRSNTSAAGTTNQVILPNNSAYFFTGEVISGVTGGGNTKGWTIEGVIKRGANAASTALVGTPTITSMYADVGAATWAIAVTADTTNGGLRVTFTGQASTTIRTVCQIRTTEMTY
jgi:hypothetical protein